MVIATIINYTNVHMETVAQLISSRKAGVAIFATAILLLVVGLTQLKQGQDVTTTVLELPDITAEETTTDSTTPEIAWQDYQVQSGDSLSRIFQNLNLPASLVSQLAHLEHAHWLTELQPGDALHFRIEDQQLLELSYPISLEKTLHITHNEQGYESELDVTPLASNLQFTEGTVQSSLSQTTQQMGLSRKQLYELIAMFGNQLNFKRDVHQGDHVRVLYQQYFANGAKVKTGHISAAEYTTNKKTYRVVRYKNKKGRYGYYTTTGKSTEFGLARYPVKFKRISSRFTGSRMHPVYRFRRPHHGVDFAAHYGTPIHATGDGTITRIGRRGGYGNAITIRHNGHYQTIYAHMSRFAKGVHRKSKVHKGQVIGYIGSTGLSTGPHLHYEVRINGRPRDPLSIRLPGKEAISKAQMPHFSAYADKLFASMQLQSQAV